MRYILLTILLFLFFSNPGFSQAPDLRSLSSFALFTAAGAFDNLGSSSITGDIGTNTANVTGFLPGVVSGDIVETGNPVASQAASDVSLIYSDLESTTCDSVIGTTLGSGQILTPKIYCLGGLSTLNGDLILDGQGNPNAVFIFKINGALTTSSLSSVSLINSASSDNVYWQINGQLEVSDNSIFRGIAAVNGAINLLESTSVEGRCLSIAGAISLHNNNVFFTPLIVPLPIELVSFEVEKNGSCNLLKWRVLSQENNAEFSVEKTMDGVGFELIGNVDGAGTTIEEMGYYLIDANVKQEINYYRIKQTDFDGKSVLFPMISVDNRKTEIHKDIIFITNLLGQEVSAFETGFVIFHYLDGTFSNINYKVNFE